MSSLLRWALTVPFIVIIIGFSALHAENITINFEPLYKNIDVPLFVPVIIFMFIGFLWGALINWVNAAPLRNKTRQQNKEIKALKKELNTLKDELRPKAASDNTLKASGTAFDLLPASKDS